MSDDDQTIAADETPEPLVDNFAGLGQLIALMSDPAAAKARMLELEGKLKEIAKAEQALTARQVEFAEFEKSSRAELDKASVALTERRNRCYEVEGLLEERQERISKLEKSWKYLGEPADVIARVRSPERTPLEKAEFAFGQPSNLTAEDHAWADRTSLLHVESPAPDASRAARMSAGRAERAAARRGE
jgi:hypothetical protein